MKKKLLLLPFAVVVFSFFSCEEDAVKIEVIEDVELDRASDPDDDENGGMGGYGIC